MLVGYCRSSTVEQAAGFEGQKRDLIHAGSERIYSEQVSSVATRKELNAALDYLRDGDVLLVTRLDRLARSMRDLCEIVARIESRGASLRVLAMQLDTSSATGKLMMNVLGSVAEFERSIMLERQREGIAKAKAVGKYKGRKPTARALSDQVFALLHSGNGPARVAKSLGIGRSSVYRLMRSIPKTNNE